LICRIQRYDRFRRSADPEQNANDFALFFNLFDRIKPALTASRANATSLFPRLARFQVGIPKRPRAALGWPRFVNRAAAFLVVEENAIAVGQIKQRHAISLATRVLLFKRIQIGLANFLRDSGYFLGRHPDVTRRARAAVAALCAFESQPVLVPN
jgi:hypothetical protein